MFPLHASFTAHITIHQLDAVPFLSGHFAVICKLKHSRGSTLFHPLRDHSVRWNYHLSTPLRLDLDRFNGHLFPSPLKLHVIHRPTDTHHEHPLGFLHLNLSAYVGHGPVQRRYLLRDSKTNATLKVFFFFAPFLLPSFLISSTPSCPFSSTLSQARLPTSLLPFPRQKSSTVSPLT
ncbi:hypothetical protein Ac2012v2_007563 [Leucoagaricus gongylophorus]